MQGCSVREIAARFNEVLTVTAPEPGTGLEPVPDALPDPASAGLPRQYTNTTTLARIPCPGMVALQSPAPPPPPPPPPPLTTTSPSSLVSSSSSSSSSSWASSSVTAEGDAAEPPGHRAFRATHVWSELLAMLRGRVDARRRRVHLRFHDDCFTGADAVDVLLTHLARTPSFTACELSRLKVTRLCQAFVDFGELEPLGSTRRFGFFGEKRVPAFEDSSSSFYRLPLDGDGKRRLGVVDATSCVAAELDVSLKETGDRSEASTPISSRTMTELSERNLEQMFDSVDLGPSLPASVNSAKKGSLLSKETVAEVWRHQTLLRLLQLIDLTVLDSVLESPPLKRGKKPVLPPPPVRPPPADEDDGGGGGGHDDLVIHNSCLEMMDSSLGLPVLDEWLAAALDCLDHLPDVLVVEVTQRLPRGWGPGGTGDPDVAKRVLFDVIGRHYGQAKQPLLENRLFDIHTAILELILQDRTAVALEATQLCLRLLDAKVREELRALLRFMHVAALASSFRLHKQADNLGAARRAFGKAIVQNKALSKSHTELLVHFMMDNQMEIFKVPAPLHVAVSKRLASLREGGDPDRPPDVTFCVRQSSAAYAAEGSSATQEALRQLVAGVSVDTTRSVKHKRRLLKELQKHHPHAFSQHFSTML